MDQKRPALGRGRSEHNPLSAFPAVREDWPQLDSGDVAAVLGHTAFVAAADIDAVAVVLGHTASAAAAADIDAARVAAVAAGSVDTATGVDVD